MIFCGKKENGHIEFTFTNEEFKTMCEDTNSYFLGLILKSEDPIQIEGIFWLNHYQFEILWELDQISDRRFLRPIKNGMRKLCVLAETTMQPIVGTLGKLSMLRDELGLDKNIAEKNQIKLSQMVNSRLDFVDELLFDARIRELYFNAYVYLLQGDNYQKHQLRFEQMSLIEFSQRKEVSPFIEY